MSITPNPENTIEMENHSCLETAWKAQTANHSIANEPVIDNGLFQGASGLDFKVYFILK